ncbi:serine protease [Proteus mirabilis]|uniref:Serine protease n=1 Tax=Proteus mirabilis TaxID=584 RepID=A0A379GDS2_PROMI|nr:serine protease [Proteus mirabilis]
MLMDKVYRWPILSGIFDLSHPDLLANNITPLFPLTEKTDQADHGTAVAG